MCTQASPNEIDALPKIRCRWSENTRQDLREATVSEEGREEQDTATPGQRRGGVTGAWQGEHYRDAHSQIDRQRNMRS